MKFKNNGFTLIECLVALFIIAVVLASATRAIGLIISDVQDSFIREAANWVAQNEYSEYVLSGVYPNLGPISKKVNMAGLEFNINENIEPTQNPYFRKISISVNEVKRPNYIIFRTVNFISQY